MTPEELAAAVTSALHSLAGERRGAVTLPAVRVERPRNPEHGDWATSVALQAGKALGTPPRELAQALAGLLAQVPGIGAVQVAGPGFLNVTLDAGAAGALARTILEAGEAYGRAPRTGERVNVEFVSANPTGPLHLGHTRWAAVGDAMARVVEAGGADVVREYYFNDHGAQIDRYTRSLLAAALGEPTPEDGYHGDYIAEIAAALVAEHPGILDLPEAERAEAFRRHGVAMMFDRIKASLAAFRTHFDVWFHEDELHASGAVDRAVARLRERGAVYEQDGATWLRSTAYGDDKDRVVLKSDGRPAYLSGDLAYYLDKRERGFDRVIILLGADHHGYVPRMMAMCAAFGDTPQVNLEIPIGQMVHLKNAGRLSKRAGSMVLLEDLVEAVGVDAARYALTRSSIDSTLELDVDLLASARNENPVHYVRYAHARSASTARRAAEDGVRREDGFCPALLAHPAEAALVATLGDYPRVVAQAAELREPHRVARYLEELAAAYHRWYDTCRVRPVGDEAVTDLHRARLWLNDAAGQVLRNGLGLLGVDAPASM